jgi:large subunit ribosomal protein L25
MTITLEVKKREERGKQLRKLREAGVVPGVVYGPKEESVSLSVDGVQFEKVLREAGESSVVVLKGLGGDKEVLVQDVEFDPIKGKVAHVDFYALEAGKEITTNVPLVFIGESPALKVGGSVSRALFEVEVTCMPKDLPHDIEVDISSLEEIGASLHVSDLKVPNGVTIENESDDVVASVVEVEEEVEEEPEAVDMDAIEVEQKGKEEGEGAEEGSAVTEENKE